MIKNTLFKGALFAALLASQNVFAAAPPCMSVTVINNTTTFNLTIKNDQGQVVIGSNGQQHGFCMPNHNTWNLYLDTLTPGPWKTYSYGSGGIGYSIDSNNSKVKNFSVNLSPAPIGTQTGVREPTVTVATDNVVLPSTSGKNPITPKFFGVGFRIDVHGAIAPTTVTFTDSK